VNLFKYLGTIINSYNSIEEEIKERIAAGNRAYHVHKNRAYHVHKNRAYHVHKKTIFIKINISKRQTTTATVTYASET